MKVVEREQADEIKKCYNEKLTSTRLIKSVKDGV